MKHFLLLPIFTCGLLLLGCPIGKEMTSINVILTCKKRAFSCDSIVVLCVNKNTKQEIDMQRVQIKDSSYVLTDTTACKSRWESQNVRDGDTVIINIEINNTILGFRKLVIDTVEIEYDRKIISEIFIGSGYPYDNTRIIRKISFEQYTGSVGDTLYVERDRI